MRKMKKQIVYILVVAFAAFSFTSCGDGPFSESESNITIPPVSDDPLDQWIMDNYTLPYNIKVNYAWNAEMNDPSRPLVPAKRELVLPFLKIVKKVWLDPYAEASELGDQFMPLYSARDLVLVGSGSWNTGSVTLGWASGGYKVTLFTVNQFDMEKGISYDDLKRFFHTFHHEFAHILNQRKKYSADFKKISGGYNADWESSNDEKAREDGFMTAYGSSADTEEFVEIYSIYVTSTVAEWDEIMGSIRNPNGRSLIGRKLQMVRDYFTNSYGLDMDKMRESVVSAIKEVTEGNLD